jgi:GTP-binding protein LepA
LLIFQNHQINRSFGIKEDSILKVSGKSGKGTEELLEAVVSRIPPPRGSKDAPLQALVFDTWFDTYRGVVLMVRVKDGTIQAEDRVMLKATQRWYEVQEVGAMHPEAEPVQRLSAGQVGYIICNMKHAAEARVGDTVVREQATAALEGFKPPLPMVFAGVYPMDSSEFDQLNKSIEKLTLNDSSVAITKESSNALGLGFRYSSHPHPSPLVLGFVCSLAGPPAASRRFCQHPYPNIRESIPASHRLRLSFGASAQRRLRTAARRGETARGVVS